MIYKVIFIFAVLFVIFILNLVRKNKLDEKYSVLWIVLSLIILFVSVFPNVINRIAGKIGVYYSPSLIFLIGLVIVGAYIIHITVTLTKQNKIIVKLTQELGILKEKIEKENK